MSKTLSHKKKLEYLPLLIERDCGFSCHYCKRDLRVNDYIYEHLNNNRNDNRVENLVLSCQSCNIKKINDFDMRIIADEKLKENEDKNFVREKISDENSSNPITTEIDINTSNFDITEQYLYEIINTDGHILYSAALNSCVFLCKKKTGHGSQQAIRNYLATLTSEVAPYKIERNENKKKVIVKRTEN